MAVSNFEEVEMTDKQSQRMGDLEQFFAVQKALDKVTDPESRTILEEQKKELTQRLDPSK